MPLAHELQRERQRGCAAEADQHVQPLVGEPPGAEAHRLQGSRYLPATEETNSATAWIWLGLSWPLNEGITPFPFVTRSTTSAFGGFASSRFGPTVPLAPASFSVWQLLQPAVSKTCLPCAARSPPPLLPPSVVVGGGGLGRGARVGRLRCSGRRRAARRGDARDRGDVGGDVLRVEPVTRSRGIPGAGCSSSVRSLDQPRRCSTANRIWPWTTLRIVDSLKPCARGPAKASSRFGPIFPCVPASASVWQRAALLAVKSSLPCVVSALPCGDAARAATGREQRRRRAEPRAAAARLKPTRASRRRRSARAPRRASGRW